MTGISVSRNPTEPVFVGEVVRATAVGSGGVPPYEFKYILKCCAGPSVTFRDWSTDPTLETRLPTVGGFSYEVWGRSAGATLDTPQVITTLFLSSVAVPTGPIQSLLVSTNVMSPRPEQQPILLTARTSGGALPKQFKWFINGLLVQDWTTSDTYTWIPPTAGVYSIRAWGRSGSGTADTPEASDTIPFTITGSAPPQMTGIIFGPLLETRSASGTTLSLTWSGTGGTPPYQYQVQFQRDNAPLQVVRDWSAASSIEQPVAAAGWQTLRIVGRSAGSPTGAAEVALSYRVLIWDPLVALPPTGISVVADLPSPQPLGTTVHFNATASGGGDYSYRTEIQLGDGSALVYPGWGSGPFVWKPNLPGTYTITTFARQYRAGDDAPQVHTSLTFVITP